MKIKSIKTVNDQLIDEKLNQNLQPDKVYYVIGVDDENYRVINETGEPILYPKKLFTVVDPKIPEGWVKKSYSDGEYFIDPPELSEPGFYEDYFDGKPYALEIFRNFIGNYLY